MDYEECSVCGVTGREVRLLDVVSFREKGVVKVCDSCAKKEDLPVLRRPTTFQLKESEKKERIYKRPSASGERGVKDFSKKESTEIGLRDLVERNYEKNISDTDERKPKQELVENFHWVIMRARRAKKMTPEQLAKEISESVAAVKMVEKGILPEDDHLLINKLESFLDVKIVKDRYRDKVLGEGDIKRKAARVIKFDPAAMKDLTIDDLRKMKEEKEKSGGFQGKEVEGKDSD